MRKSFYMFLIILLALSPYVNIGLVHAKNENTIKSPIVHADGKVTFNAAHDSEELYVVGSFNGWDIDNPYKMDKENGIFTTTLELEPGTHEYKFVEGKSWNVNNFKDKLNPSEKGDNSVVIVPELYEYTINYYRYDDKAMDWDMWIFGDGLEGKAYQFNELNDNFAKATYKLPLDKLTVITRLGEWDHQEMDRHIAMPKGKNKVEVWIVQGDEKVYYEKPEISDDYFPPTVRFVYERENKDYDGWNIWVWNTGAKDDQIDFDSINDVAIADIEVGPNTKNMGFKLRKGTDWAVVDVDQDREIDISPTEKITKVFVKEGEEDFFTVPFASSPLIKDGKVTFYYRDADLFREDEMDTIDSVQVKINGEEYDLEYNKKEERFIRTIKDLEDGEYEYTYLVTVDGITTEIADPYNLSNDGKSYITLSTLDIDITPELSQDSIDYNQHSVLSLNILNDGKEVKQDLIREAYVDLSALGGLEKTQIDPELNAISIAVKDTVSTGTKILPITVVDMYGVNHEAEAEINVKPREISDPNDFDWDEAMIYFMLTDRFADGNKANNTNIGHDPDKPGHYHGGDFKGITDNIDYLDDLGINTIWITPIVENVYHDVAYNDSNANGVAYHGYHGYWAKDFEKLNPHLGTLDEFHELIDVAADKGIKIMVDVVLNHVGYGLKMDDGNEKDVPEGYPTDADRQKFENMLRQDGGTGGEVTGELSGLPDFITEDPEVREKIVNWQVDWLEKATTKNGNTIDYFRVDTVKHVENTTWLHFKNELTLAKPDFKLIGEAWGAGPNNQYAKKYLKTGMMDSLLDFEFKGIAENLVNGNIDSVNQKMKERTAYVDNTATLGQFLGSHDEDGFLHYIREQDNIDKLKIAASLQITSKGQPVIYYGEELGLSGENNWPYYDNRYDFPWNKVENNDVHAHYKKLLNIRKDNSKLFSKGTYELLVGNDELGYMIFKRSHNNKSAIVGINTKDEAVEVSFNTPFKEEAKVTDVYHNEELSINNNQVKMTLPSSEEGGTFILISDQDDREELEVEKPIPENTIRIHYQREDGNYKDFGLWLWDDVLEPSEEKGSWPSGGTPFSMKQITEYGAYLDIPLKSDATNIGFLVLNMNSGDKDGDDKEIELFSPEINEVWITEGSDEVSLVEPIDLPENTIRVHFNKEDGNYDDWGLWTWGDVVAPTDGWPEGAHNSSGIGKFGAFYDLEVKEGADEIGFLFVNKANGNQTDNYVYSMTGHNQIFVVEGDYEVYTNPYGSIPTLLMSGEVISDNKIQLRFTTIEDITEDELLDAIVVKDKNGTKIDIEKVKKIDEHFIELFGKFDLNEIPFSVTFKDQDISISSGWRMIDEMYGYDGELGAKLNEDGSATIKLWAPKADDVSIVLYDKDDQFNVVKDRIPMELGERGVWQVDLNKKNSGLDNLRGYYYHYEITHGGETKLALDPYAKSMATWANEGSGGTYPVGKAAIVDPSTIGPDLDFAQIEGFEKREDAIIYEVHVRDFTSDPSIEGELQAQFGTFASFIEKLDYLQDLGVTHIQLLPVMSYYFGNEWESDKRILEWSSQNNNYNWGYDPHSYFSLTGMYSENPDDPEQRIKEFKTLINEIHKRGMGVMLDVVYNHTAKVEIFEDLVPNYYHFMDADGTPRESFGGGRLGTTHKMSRRILVDSITYWVEEFKVDGFRFDMMGDHDAETIQLAYDKAKAINPNIVMIGEGWVTYVGDEGDPVMPADQHWMQYTESVGSFSDEFRNELKSGFGSEGEPRFITGGARNIQQIFDNLTANPHNFKATNPGDVVPYIAAHDNLTLHDVIAQSIKKDPDNHQDEIHKRIRLGNLMTLTAQGTAFLHAGQEFGRTKQFREHSSQAPYKSTYMTDENGNPFNYPYFIHDSYDSSDSINKFDWQKAMNDEKYPINHVTKEYTKGLIELRRSTDAFRLGTMDEVRKNVSLIKSPEIQNEDLVIGYETSSSDSNESYYIFVNADDRERTLTLGNIDLTKGEVIVDKVTAGTKEILEPSGVELSSDKITIDPLTAIIIKMEQSAGKPGKDVDPKEPGDSGSKGKDDKDSKEPEDNDPKGKDDKDSKSPVDTESTDSQDSTRDDVDKNIKIDKSDEEDVEGKNLPKTATNQYNWILLGMIFLLLGIIFIFDKRKRKLD